MDRKELEAKIISFFATTYDQEASALSMDTKIKEELSSSSMLMVSLVSTIENEIDVMIPLPDAGKFKTIGDVVDMVEGQL